MSDAVAVLDTNVFGTNADLTTPLWVSFLRLSSESGIEVCVPDLVLTEAINLRREKYREAEREYLEANRKISRFVEVAPVYVPGVEDVLTEWEADLRANFRVLEHAADDALEALKREALRTPPASAGRGARDSLIWLTARRLAGEGRTVYLISRNTKDFCGNGGKQLTPVLQAELSDVAGSLTFLESLDAFFELIATKVPAPILEDVAPVQNLLDFDLWDFALDEFDLKNLNGEEAIDLTIRMEGLRSLRAYDVDGRGMALIDGRAAIFDAEGSQTIAPALKFMAWIEFDLESGKATAAELEKVTAGT